MKYGSNVLSFTNELQFTVKQYWMKSTYVVYIIAKTLLMYMFCIYYHFFKVLERKPHDGFIASSFSTNEEK